MHAYRVLNLCFSVWQKVESTQNTPMRPHFLPNLPRWAQEVEGARHDVYPLSELQKCHLSDISRQFTRKWVRFSKRATNVHNEHFFTLRSRQKTRLWIKKSCKHWPEIFVVSPNSTGYGQGLRKRNRQKLWKRVSKSGAIQKNHGQNYRIILWQCQG